MLLNNPMISTTHSILTNSKTGKNPDPKIRVLSIWVNNLNVFIFQSFTQKREALIYNASHL